MDGNHDDPEALALARAHVRTPVSGPAPLGFRLHRLRTEHASVACAVSRFGRLSAAPVRVGLAPHGGEHVEPLLDEMESVVATPIPVDVPVTTTYLRLGSERIVQPFSVVVDLHPHRLLVVLLPVGAGHRDRPARPGPDRPSKGGPDLGTNDRARCELHG